MTGARFGLGFQGDKTVAEYVELAKATEAYGFDVLSVYNDLMFQPSFHPLLVAAMNTSRIQLGPACLNPFTTMPHEIAGQIAVLDSVSGGRAYLGLARGAWLDAVGVSQERPLRTLREAIGVVYHLLEQRTEPFSGEVFRLAPHTTLQFPVHRPDPPLLLGGWGPQLVALASEVADELKVGGSANPALAREISGSLRATELAGDHTTPAIVMGAVSVVDDDGAAARRKARREVAMYLAVVAELDRTLDVDPELIQRVGELVGVGDREAAGELVPDGLLDLFCFSGTPAAVAEQAEALLDAGAARIEFGTPHGLTHKKGVDLLGSEVLSRLRAWRADPG